MGEDELDAMSFKEVAQPVSSGGAFDDGLVRTGERSEIRQNDIGGIVQSFLLHDLAPVVDSRDEAVVFVQIDT